MKPKKVRRHIILEEEIDQKIQRMADQNHRNFSNQVTHMIESFFNARKDNIRQKSLFGSIYE